MALSSMLPTIAVLFSLGFTALFMGCDAGLQPHCRVFLTRPRAVVTSYVPVQRVCYNSTLAVDESGPFEGYHASSLARW